MFVRFLISAETGNVLIWHRLAEQVLYKEEQQGVRQLTLMDEGTKVIAISKPSNPPGSDLVRTVATVVVRSIPGNITFKDFYIKLAGWYLS